MTLDKGSIPLTRSFRACRRDFAESGMTLIEIILVVALMAVIYSVAMPQLNIKTGTEVASKMGTLAADIRSAYDMAVLYRRPYRMVFHLASGEYWLETTERDDFTLGDSQLDRDPSPEEQKEAIEAFEEEFKEYETLAGQEIEDSVNERMVKPTSPVVAAKDLLAPPKWEPVESSEWSRRTIGPSLLFMDIKAEHHKEKQTLEALGANGHGFLYFFPSGYVEKAVIHVAYRKGEMDIDEKEAPFTLVTNPYQGTAEVTSGYQEPEVLDGKS